MFKPSQLIYALNVIIGIILGYALGNIDFKSKSKITTFPETSYFLFDGKTNLSARVDLPSFKLHSSVTGLQLTLQKETSVKYITLNISNKNFKATEQVLP